MFNEFRLNFLRELVTTTNLSEDDMQKVMLIVDKMGTEFDMSHKETALVPMGLVGQQTVMEYLACRSLEGLSKLTLYRYSLILSHFIATLNKPIENIQTNDIRLYLYQYQQHRGVSNRTLEGMRGAIAVFFKWLVAERRISYDPAAAIKPIKYVTEPRTALTQLELEYIRRVCYSKREKAIIETLYSTGCRVSEVCALKKNDIDWQTHSAKVFGKGGKYRTVFINAKAYVAIQDYIASRDDTDEHLFVSERKPHQGLSRFSIEKIIRDISDRAYKMTGKHVTPHIFRHTTATTALQNGMPVQNISKMLGHERIETTMIYAEIDNNDIQRDHTKFVV